MKFGIIFPGYGNQFVGMGKEFYDNSRSMQEYFEEAANCLDKNFVKLCFASSEANLAELENSYISLFLVSLSIATILKEHEIEPSIVAGNNIGEYAALATVNGITLPDAVYLLRKYAGLYQQFLKEKRVEAIRVKNIDLEKLKEICDNCVNGNNVANISVYELDNQAIVTGTIDSIAFVRKAIEDMQSGPVEDIPIGQGLHSPLMDDILKDMKKYLEKVDFKDSAVPVVASVTGQALKEGDSLRAAVMQQIYASLKWNKVMDGFSFCDVIIIAGPGDHLKKLLETAHPDKKVFSIIGPDDLNVLLEFAGKPKMELEDKDDSNLT